MNQNFVLANQSQSRSLLPSKLALKQAKLYAPLETLKLQVSVEEQLASKLIANMKKSYRRPSPFAMWMGQPFPHEYKEMVAADVR
jgi:hypothetical protein